MFTKISIFRVLSVFLIAGILLGSAIFPISVRADSTITVTTIDDELNTDGDCSLREAIQAANTNAAVDACTAGTGADTIIVPAGTYTLTITGANEDVNATGDLDITDSVTINGAGAGSTIIQAGTDSTNGIDRVFQIAAGITVSIFDVTIANGKCIGYCNGGGIANIGILIVTDSIFSDNSTDHEYIYFGSGGGISNGGSLTVVNTTFVGNYSNFRGSGIFNNADASVNNSLFSGNVAYIYGGGIFNESNGTLIATNNLYSDNSADYGGGIYNNGGTSTVKDSTFLGNFARRNGGGIGQNGKLISLNNTFLGNNANSNGGGIYNDGQLYVVNTTFSANTAAKGGGISNFQLGSVIIRNSTFSGNASAMGVIHNWRGSLNTSNSILANTASNYPDCYNFNGAVGGKNNLIEMDASGTNACGTTSPIHADPNLGPLADNGGLTQTFALLPGSPAIDAGDDAICAASPVNNTSQNGVTRPQGVHCDIGSFEAPVTSPYTFRSVGTNDGWILESTETSGTGGTMNTNGQSIALGDDAADKQYRSILHFDTASLPDNAVITKVTLSLKKKAVVGTDPFTTHQYIKVGIRSGGFSNNTALQLTDFQSAASKNWIGTIKNTPVGDWYSAVLNKLAFPFVNLTSATQFRLSFALDDDNDNIADYIQFYSGNAVVADRPQLIVEYYIP